MRVLVSGRVRFRQGLWRADLGGRERGVRGGEYMELTGGWMGESLRGAWQGAWR